MPRPIIAVAALAWGLSSPTLALGQEATEIFIPLGQSPGVSNKISVIGPIDSVDTRGRSLSLATASGTVTFAITDKTRIWLDRSPLKLSNQPGTLADLQKGRKAEVKPGPGEGKRPAEWVKVQITEADPPN